VTATALRNTNIFHFSYEGIIIIAYMVKTLWYNHVWQFSVLCLFHHIGILAHLRMRITVNQQKVVDVAKVQQRTLYTFEYPFLAKMTPFIMILHLDSRLSHIYQK